MKKQKKKLIIGIIAFVMIAGLISVKANPEIFSGSMFKMKKPSISSKMDFTEAGQKIIQKNIKNKMWTGLNSFKTDGGESAYPITLAVESNGGCTLIVPWSVGVGECSMRDGKIYIKNFNSVGALNGQLVITASDDYNITAEIKGDNMLVFGGINMYGEYSTSLELNSADKIWGSEYARMAMEDAGIKSGEEFLGGAWSGFFGGEHDTDLEEFLGGSGGYSVGMDILGIENKKAEWDTAMEKMFRDQLMAGGVGTVSSGFSFGWKGNWDSFNSLEDFLMGFGGSGGGSGNVGITIDEMINEFNSFFDSGANSFSEGSDVFESNNDSSDQGDSGDGFQLSGSGIFDYDDDDEENQQKATDQGYWDPLGEVILDTEVANPVVDGDLEGGPTPSGDVSLGTTDDDDLGPASDVSTSEDPVTGGGAPTPDFGL